MSKIYNSFADIPRRRGVYLVNAEFADNTETVRVHVVFDVDENTDTPITDRYGYFVESLDHNSIYASCWGFKTIKDMLPNIPPRLREIR